jgi:hypothetical protein
MLEKIILELYAVKFVIIISIINLICGLCVGVYIGKRRSHYGKLYCPSDFKEEKIFLTTGASEKQEWNSILQEELEKISSGSIMFNPPDVMTLGGCERIEVRISRDLECILTDNLKGHGVPQVETLNIYDFMTVRLTGDGFDIIPHNEGGQIIPNEGYSEWSWDVTPEKAGIRKLHLHVTLRIYLLHGEEKMDIPVLDRDIFVKANVKYTVIKLYKNNWKWLIGVLGISIVAGIWKIYEFWYGK